MNTKLKHLLLKGEIEMLKKNYSLREKLKKHHVFYAFLGGIGIVLFWHGIWESLNLIYRNVTSYLKYIGHPVTSLIVGSLILAVTGLYVFELIGRDARAFEEKYESKLDELKKIEKVMAEEEIQEQTEEDLKQLAGAGTEFEEE